MKNKISSIAAALVLLAGCSQEGVNNNSNSSQSSSSSDYRAYINLNRHTDVGKKSVILFADTSPSMTSPVNGVSKIDSARSSLMGVLGNFNEHNGQYHDLEVGLLSIGDSSQVRVDVPLTNFNYQLLSNAVYNMQIGSGTPLGPGLEEARKQLENLGTGLESIIMFSDGEANAGVDPIQVYGGIVETDKRAGRAPMRFHFAAFATDPGTLEVYSNLGAQTYSADNGQQLQKVLEYAGNKVLLEDEESTNTPGK